jgi:hypothetical protein
MKSSLAGVLLVSTVLTGCVLPSPPSLVTVQERQPETVYVNRPVYSPGYTTTTLSPGYRTVHHGRNVYYVDRDTYYRRSNRGYVVVPRPY